MLLTLNPANPSMVDDDPHATVASSSAGADEEDEDTNTMASTPTPMSSTPRARVLHRHAVKMWLRMAQ
jgi:hypothetical protein